MAARRIDNEDFIIECFQELKRIYLMFNTVLNHHNTQTKYITKKIQDYSVQGIRKFKKDVDLIEDDIFDLIHDWFSEYIFLSEFYNFITTGQMKATSLLIKLNIASNSYCHPYLKNKFDSKFAVNENDDVILNCVCQEFFSDEIYFEDLSKKNIISYNTTDPQSSNNDRIYVTITRSDLQQENLELILDAIKNLHSSLRTTMKTIANSLTTYASSNSNFPNEKLTIPGSFHPDGKIFFLSRKNVESFDPSIILSTMQSESINNTTEKRFSKRRNNNSSNIIIEGKKTVSFANPPPPPKKKSIVSSFNLPSPSSSFEDNSIKNKVVISNIIVTPSSLSTTIPSDDNNINDTTTKSEENTLGEERSSIYKEKNLSNPLSQNTAKYSMSSSSAPPLITKLLIEKKSSSFSAIDYNLKTDSNIDSFTFSSEDDDSAKIIKTNSSNKKSLPMIGNNLVKKRKFNKLNANAGNTADDYDEIYEDEDEDDDADDYSSSSSESLTATKKKKSNNLLIVESECIFNEGVKKYLKTNTRNAINSFHQVDQLIINFFSVFLLQQIRLLYFPSNVSNISIKQIYDDILKLVYYSIKFHKEKTPKRGPYKKKILQTCEEEKKENYSSTMNNNPPTTSDSPKLRNQTLKRHLISDMKSAVGNIVKWYDILKENNKVASLFSLCTSSTNISSIKNIENHEIWLSLEVETEVLTGNNYITLATIIDELRLKKKDIKLVVNENKKNKDFKQKKNPPNSINHNNNDVSLPSQPTFIQNANNPSFLTMQTTTSKSTQNLGDEEIEISSSLSIIQQNNINEYEKLASAWKIIISILFNNSDSVYFHFNRPSCEDYYIEVMAPLLHSLPQQKKKKIEQPSSVRLHSDKSSIDLLCDDVELLQNYNSLFVFSIIKLFFQLLRAESSAGVTEIKKNVVDNFSINLYLKPMRNVSIMPNSIKHLSFYYSIESYCNIESKLFPDHETDNYDFYKIKDLVKALEKILQNNIKEKNQYTSTTCSMLNSAKDFFEFNHTTIDEKIMNQKEINLPELLQGRPAVIDSLGGILFVECDCFLNSSDDQCFILKRPNNFTKSKYLFGNLYMYELYEINFFESFNQKFFLMGSQNSFSTRTNSVNVDKNTASSDITKHIVTKIFHPNVNNFREKNKNCDTNKDVEILLLWALNRLTSEDIIETILYSSSKNINDKYENVESSFQQKSSVFKETNFSLMCFGIEKTFDLSIVQIENNCLKHENIYLKKLLMMKKTFYQDMSNPMYRFPIFKKKIIYTPSDTTIDETELLVQVDPNIERKINYYDCVYSSGQNIVWAPQNYVNIQISLEINRAQYSSLRREIVCLFDNAVFEDFSLVLNRFPENETSQFEGLQKILIKYNKGFTNQSENIFEKDFFLMPVHFINHYFLVVILFARNIMLDDHVNADKNKIPCILVFDSLFNSVTAKKIESIHKIVTSFLHLKWKYFMHSTNDDIFKTKQIPIYIIEDAVQQDDYNSCGYCTIFNTQNVLKMIFENKLVASTQHLSSSFSQLITKSMKKEMKGYLLPFVNNVIFQREKARAQLCTWAKYLSSF
jgi:hypothetical protein